MKFSVSGVFDEESPRIQLNLKCIDGMVCGTKECEDLCECVGSGTLGSDWSNEFRKTMIPCIVPCREKWRNRVLNVLDGSDVHREISLRSCFGQYKSIQYVRATATKYQLTLNAELDRCEWKKARANEIKRSWTY